MRILFVTFPWRSHHFPMVPLEWACLAAGHEVRVASAPSLVDTIITSGLQAVAVGRDVDLPRLATDPRRAAWHLQRRWPRDWPVHPERLDGDQHDLVENLGRMQAVMAGAMLDDLLDFARAWGPDLVVHDAVTLAGPVVAAALKVPNVSHLWGTPGAQRIELRRLSDEPLPEYASLYERVGAPVRTEPTAWVDPCAPGMAYPIGPTCRPMRYVPYNGPGVLPRWLLDAPSPRRVCVTWGGTTTTLLGTSVVRLVRQAVEATAELATEVVVAVDAKARDHLVEGGLPPHVRVEADLPLHLLLPTCTAVVHHGGAGTTMTAAGCGLPQLAVSFRPEPAVNGTRLAAYGAGRALLSAEVPDGPDGVELMRHEVDQLLDDPSYRTAAGRLRDGLLASPTPTDVAAQLVALA